MFAWVQLAGFLVLLTALTPVLGGYMAAVFGAPDNRIRHVGGRFERSIYRLCRIDPTHDMHWSEYLIAVLVFSAVSATALFVLLCTQGRLPLNPQHFSNLLVPVGNCRHGTGMISSLTQRQAVPVRDSLYTRPFHQLHGNQA